MPLPPGGGQGEGKERRGADGSAQQAGCRVKDGHSIGGT